MFSWCSLELCTYHTGTAQHCRGDSFHYACQVPRNPHRCIDNDHLIGYDVCGNWGTYTSRFKIGEFQDWRIALHLPRPLHCRPPDFFVPIRYGRLGMHHGNLDSTFDFWYPLPWRQAARCLQWDFPAVWYWNPVYGRLVHLGGDVRYRSNREIDCYRRMRGNWSVDGFCGLWWMCHLVSWFQLGGWGFAWRCYFFLSNEKPILLICCGKEKVLTVKRWLP